MRSKRRSKVVSASRAVSIINPGCRLALGGLELVNKPMYLVREVVRRGIGRLSVMTSPCASLDVELLVGSGLVRELISPRVSLGNFGPAPATTKALANGGLRRPVIDSASLVAGFRAAAFGLTAASVPGSIVSHVRGDSPLLREYTGPSGRPELAVRPLVPDVTLVHAQESDQYGNARQLGGTMYDLLMAKASKNVILQVDRVVEPEEIAGEPGGVTIPGTFVTFVVQAQMAAHPAASAFSYLQDDKEIWEYATKAATQEGFNEYIRDRVRSAATQREYLAKLPRHRLEELDEWWGKPEDAGSEGIFGQEDFFRG